VFNFWRRSTDDNLRPLQHFSLIRVQFLTTAATTRCDHQCLSRSNIRSYKRPPTGAKAAIHETQFNVAVDLRLHLLLREVF